MKNSIKINPLDNVAVALCNLNCGQTVEGVTLAEDIVKGHKFSLRNIDCGQDVVKYGEVIGVATQHIAAGSHVHTHNLKTKLDGQLQYEYLPKRCETNTKIADGLKVNVYRRANGEVGIRNELWVIPTVGCVNSQAQAIVKRFVGKAAQLDGVDGVYAYTHPYGCSQTGDDHERTKRLLQRIVKHPNAGGVLVLGLGCENNQISAFKETLGQYDGSRIRFLVAQDVEDEIEEGTKILAELYSVAKNDVRSLCDISCLKIGLKCGGSDGLSGITANPLLGKFSDYIAACGGTTVLTEVPEMFGAEQLLMARAKDEATFGKIVNLVNGFKNYYQSNNQPVYENPSPGNKAGGITTLEDKSLGCTQKSGSSAVQDVLFDGDELCANGLNLLNGPGNDMVAVTNLGAAGCHMVLFTTGRGTPFGGFVPTVKISTNSQLAEKKKNWIDFNAGSIIDGDTFETKLMQLLSLVTETANGKQTRNEVNGSRDIALFKTGVTL
ncbi:MAG: altronate dehydratase family protein [Corallococcus sp.]|nr:altronate dehydratase family protein [Corallococcus sp.]